MIERVTIDDIPYSEEKVKKLWEEAWKTYMLIPGTTEAEAVQHADFTTKNLPRYSETETGKGFIKCKMTCVHFINRAIHRLKENARLQRQQNLLRADHFRIHGKLPSDPVEIWKKESQVV